MADEEGPKTPPGGNGGKKPGQPAQQPPGRGAFGLVVLVMLVVVLALLFSGLTGGSKITIAEFRNHWQTDRVMEDSVLVRDDKVTAKLKALSADESPSTVFVELNAGNREIVVKEINELTGGNYRAVPPSAWFQVLMFFGPFILILLVLWFFVSRGLRSAGGGAGML
ncbi:MAG: hypothetical protein AAFU70_09865, partial [Planctomycetota bacterium]